MVVLYPSTIDTKSEGKSFEFSSSSRPHVSGLSVLFILNPQFYFAD